MPTPADTTTLRPAVIPGDTAFLAAVYASTRAAELTLTDWTDEQKAVFCQSQFEAQTRHCHLHYPGAVYQIIEIAGQPAGRLYTDRWPREIRIMDIALLPAHCGQGVGSHLLKELQAEATAAGKTLTIHVERFNPALRLYHRLGFREIEDKGVYLLLQWTPPTAGAPAAAETAGIS